MSEYFCAEGPLVLNGMKKKKKKKKSKKEDKSLEGHSSSRGDRSSDDDQGDPSASTSTNNTKEPPRLIKCELTKAQRTFKKMQEKKKLERIMEKASKSHRQRVEEFNAKLDNLSEHYDIPKVSWTK